MFKTILYSSCCILLLASCSDDGMDMGIDSVALCDCPELAAANVTYDNTASGLSGDDAQDAIDELAAQPEAPSDAFTRIMVEEMTVMSPASGTDYVMTVACTGTAPNVGRALGGSCSGASAAISVQSSNLQGNGYQCFWNKPDGVAIEFTAKVSCLMPAQ